MQLTRGNIFPPLAGERISEQHDEQFISHGQGTTAGCWYDQGDPEWVLLVRGTATLQFEAGESLALKAGDYLLIPAHLKHRVECCSDDALWLALHYAAWSSAVAGEMP